MATRSRIATRMATAALGLALAGPAPAWDGGPGRDGPMEFRLARTGGNCPTCTFVAAEGVITDTTADDLRAFLLASREDLRNPRGANLHLDSPGGSLVGGMRLGEAIREAGMNTVSAFTPGSMLPDGWVDVVPQDGAPRGICASACVAALAGGVLRYTAETTDPYAVGFQDMGQVSVQPFDDPSDPPDRLEDLRRLGELIGHLARMGVSAEILEVALTAAPESPRILTDEELRRTGLDNASAQDIAIRAYRNGVAIVEVSFLRADAAYRVELFCQSDALRMKAEVNFHGQVDASSFREWNLLEGLTLGGGAITVPLKTAEFRPGPAGTTAATFTFGFEGAALEDLVDLKSFWFEDGGSRYATEEAAALSFQLPEDFEGLHILPRTCL